MNKLCRYIFILNSFLMSVLLPAPDVSPDGSYFFDLINNQVVVRNTRTQRPVRTLDHDARCGAWSADGKYLATFSNDTAHIWFTDNWQIALTFKIDTNTFFACWAPNAASICTLSTFGCTLYHLNRNTTNTLPIHSPFHACFSPDSTKIAIGEIFRRDFVVKVYDVSSSERLQELGGLQCPIDNITWNNENEIEIRTSWALKDHYDPQNNSFYCVWTWNWRENKVLNVEQGQY